MRQREEATHDSTKEALKKLKDDKRFANKYSEPSHARYFVDQDETAPCPNTLSLHYGETQFFLDVDGSGAAQLRTTGGGQSAIGSPVRVEDHGFCDQLCSILDEHTDPIIRVNENGEAIVARPGRRESEIQKVSFSHSVCGGYMDKNKVTSTHFALSCRRCHLRVVVPNGVADVEGFKAYFAAILKG